jgi:hypothetical protein
MSPSAIPKRPCALTFPVSAPTSFTATSIPHAPPPCPATGVASNDITAIPHRVDDQAISSCQSPSSPAVKNALPSAPVSAASNALCLGIVCGRTCCEETWARVVGCGQNILGAWSIQHWAFSWRNVLGWRRCLQADALIPKWQCDGRGFGTHLISFSISSSS